ncbi:MAG: tetratricopeptide repeat-containing sensor histidine kinase, partial [Candidatus Heimdallarchaeota archaeon]|nr:tetratricopeptide repeat-containing sensor histidine kinase [Candidatus Heimdallarchaeota archaeon]
FYLKGDLVLADEYYHKALDLFNNMENEYSQAILKHDIGQIHLIRGDLDTAENYFLSSNSLWKKLKNKSMQAISLNSLGLIYRFKNNYKEAIKYLTESLKIRKRDENPILISETLFNLVQVCLDLDDIEKAKEYYKEQEILNKITDNKIIHLRTQISKGLIYENTPDIQKQITAKSIFDDILKTEIVDFKFTTTAILKLCDYLLLEYKSFEKTEVLGELETLIHRLYEIAEEQGNHIILIDALLIQAKIAEIQLDFVMSNEYLNQAEEISEIKGIYHRRIDIAAYRMKLSSNSQKMHVYTHLQDKKEIQDDTRVEMVIHDIKNLLMINRAFTNLLKSESHFSPKIEEYLKYIAKSGDDINNLLGDLLLESKHAYTQQSDYEQIDLQAIVRERINLFTTKAQERYILFDQNLQHSTVWVRIISRKLRRVLDNLILNAVKFAPQESLISITVTSDTKHGIFTISNPGEPIADVLKEHIFKKYEQLDSTIEHDEEGVGLGLAFCKDVLQEMKGDIVLESPIGNSNEGVKFIIKLPLN